MTGYLQSRPDALMFKLMKVIRGGDNQAFEHILETEGLPSAKNAADFKLLKTALVYGRSRMAQTLLSRGCRAYRRVYTGNSPLHLAASRPSCAMLVRQLFDHGARVDQRNRKQDTPLHVAFAFADGEVVDLMLERHFRNSFANERNRIGLTYLHIAATRSKLDSLMYLVEMGNADVNCKIDITTDSPYAGYTPLHMAVEYDQLDTAELLLNYDADLWARNFQGSTPLHLALERRNVEMIELLLAYDHKMENYVNDHGLSHFMATCIYSNASISIDYLLNPVNNPMELINGCVDKCDDNPTYQFGSYTPLHFAAEFGRQETVQLLLEHRADCRSRNANGSTPLHLAIENGFERVADLLVMHCHGRDSSPAVGYYAEKARGDDCGYCGDDEGEKNDDVYKAYSDSGDELVSKFVRL